MRRFPLRAILLGTLFCLVYSYAVLLGRHAFAGYGVSVGVTQIPAMGILLTVFLAAIANPVLRALRLRPFHRRELLVLLIMTMIASGIPLYGYVSQVLPMAGGLHHPEWNTPQSQWSERVEPNVDPRLFVQPAPADAPETAPDGKPAVRPVEHYVTGLRAVGRESFPVFVKRPDESLGQWMDRIGRYVRGGPDRPAFFGEVPWRAWAVPLAGWGLLALVCYLFIYSLSDLFFKQWYEHEKLVFPVAEMSAILIGADQDVGRSRVPGVFRNPVFWLGVAIAFVPLVYNGLVRAHYIIGPGLIDLRGDAFRRMLRESFLGPATGGQFYFLFEIFFLCIGIAFLLPTEISFSLWFFWLFMKSQTLLAVWLGFGADGGSFPSHWFQESSFMTAQGGGAMWMFGIVCLWKVRRSLFAWIYRLARPGGTRALPAEDAQRFTIPSALFLVGSVGLLYFLRRGNVGWGMALLVYLGLLFMTIATMRLVAECGIIAFQLHFGPLHIMRMFGLLQYPVLFAVRGIGTAILLLGSMFTDVKAFMGPILMNTKYLAVKGRISRGLQGGVIFWAIAVTLVASTIVSLAFVYDQGVSNMSGWFYTRWPQRVFNSTTNVQNNLEKWTTPEPGTVTWTGVGAATCGLLVYLRQFLFWVPHPIGLVMFVNPLMRSYWFSFLLGWLCKRSAIRYCNPDTYRFVRGLFLGLILGELLAVGLSFGVALLGGSQMDITLDR